MSPPDPDSTTFALLRTKLHMPRFRDELVPRPRLIERLNRGLDRILTLISAPAGSGKPTLLGIVATLTLTLTGFFPAPSDAQGGAETPTPTPAGQPGDDVRLDYLTSEDGLSTD
jgi:hypothetical protein